jgi:NMD protein affecting ribosome stability and mRNA decay
VSPRPRNDRPCEQCGSRPVKAKGLCGACYMRVWKRAQPSTAQDRVGVRKWDRVQRGGKWRSRRIGPAPTLDPVVVERLRAAGYWI